MKVKNFRELIVWQKALDLVEETYKASKSFPKDELYGLTSQIRRAVVSIPTHYPLPTSYENLETHARIRRRALQRMAGAVERPHGRRRIAKGR